MTTPNKLDYMTPKSIGGLDSITGVPEPRPLFPEPTLPPKPPYMVAPAPIPPASPSPTIPTPKPPVAATPVTPPAPASAIPATPGSIGLDFMRQVTPNELVENRLAGLLSGNSRYIQNARQRGAEYAGARGNINSSLAAGASERAAIEAGLPIAESDAGVYRDANQGNFESLNQLRQMRTAADLDNWLSSESFNRDYNGRLAMIPVQSAADFMGYLSQRALEDPAVWTPDVVSGWSNFFTGNFMDVFSNFFGGQPDGGG